LYLRSAEFRTSGGQHRGSSERAAKGRECHRCRVCFRSHPFRDTEGSHQRVSPKPVGTGKPLRGRHGRSAYRIRAQEHRPGSAFAAQEGFTAEFAKHAERISAEKIHFSALSAISAVNNYLEQNSRSFVAALAFSELASIALLQHSHAFSGIPFRLYASPRASWAKSKWGYRPITCSKSSMA